MAEHPVVDVIIVAFNGGALLDACVSSVLDSDYCPLRIIVVDNNSKDGSVEKVAERFRYTENVKIIRNTRNLGFAEGSNVGIRVGRGDFLMFLNQDTRVDSRCLSEIVRVFAGDDAIGALQPKLLLYDSPATIDNCGGFIDAYGYAYARGLKERDRGQYDREDEIFFGVGSAMTIRRQALDEVGMFDKAFFLLYEDVDLSWRLRLRGYKVRFVPSAIVYHKVSTSLGKRKELDFIPEWHARKNRLAMLTKNYSMRNLIITIPVVLVLYSLTFIEEVFVRRDLRLALTSFSAVLWNVRRLSLLLQQRFVVQNTIRKVPDNELTKLFVRRFIATQRNP